MKKRYLIIGGTGFIGSAIVRYLAEKGESYVSIGSKDCNLCDQTETARIIGSQVEGAILVFAAGIPRIKGDSMDTMLSNITMVSNVIKVCTGKLPEKVIFLSSVEVYGTPENLPITESTKLSPERTYAIGKITAEYMWKQWARITKKSLTILRLPGIYGPGQKKGGMIDTLIERIYENGIFKLNNEGKELRDFVFVEDIPTIIERLSEMDHSYLLLNIATGESRSVREIVEQVFVALNKRCRIETEKPQGRLCHLVFDVTRMRQVLPGITMTPINKALLNYRYCCI